MNFIKNNFIELLALVFNLALLILGIIWVFQNVGFFVAAVVMFATIVSTFYAREDFLLEISNEGG